MGLILLDSLLQEIKDDNKTVTVDVSNYAEI